MSNYKTGDKFIIELGEQVGDLWKIKGFRTLVFDVNGLEKLRRHLPGEDPFSRTKGQQEAWELAQKIRKMATDEWYAVFGRGNLHAIIEGLTYAEAAAKVEAWEKKKNAPKLTAEERTFCEAIAYPQNKYIARDKDGDLFFFNDTPIRNESEWVSEHFYATFKIAKSNFPFIKWEDEPWSIEDLLELEVQEDE